ncbi:MAG: hypothetical protein BWK80_35980 [Desulfobacteraceae bacterium IS3]|nr:MAG: hypothetical protein BWK80_35980 [Desulfobacteraceae bacterium IS3]
MKKAVSLYYPTCRNFRIKDTTIKDRRMTEGFGSMTAGSNLYPHADFVTNSDSILGYFLQFKGLTQ